MPTPTPDRIRTVAVVGHSHDGKTTLCEALLHTAGATQRMGSTEQATSLFDHEPEEQRHSMSIGLSVAHCDWDGHRVNLIDAHPTERLDAPPNRAIGLWRTCEPSAD